jgi:release factor glutamine methyltransferase
MADALLRLREPTVASLLEGVRRILSGSGVADAGPESRLLVSQATGLDMASLIASPARVVAQDCVKTLHQWLARRVKGEPLFRILGWREFYGLRLALSPDTLEPRPDTETLVDLVLPRARAIAGAHGQCRILDLGTGTGAVALALLAEIPEAVALGVDIAPGAIATATKNAMALALDTRFRAMCSSWYEAVGGTFDIIVSNPPYVRRDELATLPREVACFDPLPALDGGTDGLDGYRAIAAGAPAHLAEGGAVAVEIGNGQKEEVVALFAATGFRLEAERRDLGGRTRALLFAVQDKAAA